MTESSVRPPEPAGSRPRWLAPLQRVVRNPLAQLLVAMVLITTSLIEASKTFYDDLYSGNVRATHGLLLVGIWQVLQTMPDLIEGLERYLESRGTHHSG